MKLSTTAEALLAAMLQSVKLDKRSTIPILSNARLLGNRIITTDLDDHSIVEFDGTCDEETDLLFPFHIMAGILEDQTGPLTMELISKKPDDADGASNLPYVKIKHNGFTIRPRSFGESRRRAGGDRLAGWTKRRHHHAGWMGELVDADEDLSGT